jgi:ABC-type nickel/cobalt efflux system permease component RcnA
MASLPELIQSGTSSAWLFVPTAVLLGALHGLEPGHSKTMMAAFIVAVRGTVPQAILLGLSATLSHTAVVWAVAMGGLYFGRNLDAETSEPYFQVASAALIIAIALWMLWRTWRQSHHQHHHEHDHPHHHEHDHPHHHAHDHPHIDAHDRAHAEDIRRRFGGAAHVTTAQIIAFGLTGGLIPCPAAITVLLLCLQLKAFTLGAGLVLCFSIGLAVTMVSAGVAAAWGVRHAEKRWSGFAAFAERAPYVSAAVIILVGLFVGFEGLRAIV